MRISVRFCFVVEIAGRISESVQKLRTLQDRFPKTEQPFSISSPFAGLIKAHKCGILNSTLFERSKEVRPLSLIHISEPTRH